jgi:hypothetical protein
MLKTFLFFCVLIVSGHSQDSDSYQQQRQDGGQQQEEGQEQEGALGGGNTLDPSVPEPPSQIPETSFSCEGKPYDPGMYADEETGCRVFHMCYMGRKDSYICGTGTVFNQEILSCDYPDNVDCAASASFYAANTEFGKAGQPEPSGNEGAASKPGRSRPATTQVQEPEYAGSEEPQYAAPRPAAAQAPRPRAPAPRAPPAARPKTNPRPAQQRPAAVQRPAAKTRPRPAERPVQQLNQQINEQPLDYEPSQVVQQRVARRSKRWQVMSNQY